MEAASSSGRRKISPPLAAVSGLKTTATCATRGAICLSACSHLPAIEDSKLVNPVMFPPGCAQLSTKPLETGSETSANTIGMVRVACFERRDTGGRIGDDHVRGGRDELRRIGTQALGIAAGPSLLDADIAAVDPAQPFQFLPERADPALRFGVAFRNSQQDSDPPRPAGMLGSAHARPRGNRDAAEKRKKFPPPHAITPAKA